MSLFVDENDLVAVEVRYTEKDNKLEFYDKEPCPEGAKLEKFEFKKPSWGDQREIMEIAFGVDPNSGTPMVDPYRFMDAKFKTLLKKWTLKIELSWDNIDKLHPDLMEHLNSRIDPLLGLDQ